jgi:regulator of sirC expression with transglutaminase-like and TPR domain
VELTERFADVVARHPLPLDEAVALIGAHADPGCDVAATLRQLDELAATVEVPGLQPVLELLFDRLGFSGDDVDYYHPRNSYLHEVLVRRRGIPITLTIVLVEVARRVGVGVEVLGTPGHVVAAVPGAAQPYVDAFGGGRVLDRRGLDELFAAFAPGVDLDPYLEPLAPADVVRRVLGNLVAIHRRRGDRDSLLWASQLRTLVPGASPDDERTFGGALAACGDFARAAKVLESLAVRGDAPDPEQALAEARQLRARLN